MREGEKEERKKSGDEETNKKNPNQCTVQKPGPITVSRGENAEIWKNIYWGILKQGSHTDTQLGWFKNVQR